jgi:hypothetical protein
VRVTTSRRNLAGGRVIECAGPWRSSGGWWRPRIATDHDQPRITADKHGFKTLAQTRNQDVKTDVTTTAPSMSETRQVLGVGPQHKASKWNNDEWDVALPDGVYRIYRNRDSNQWFLEAILD